MTSNPQFDIDAELKRMDAEDAAVRSAMSNSSYTWVAAASTANSTSTDGGFESKPVDVDLNPLLTPDQFKDRWANRRKMAWLALLANVVVTMLLFFAIDAEKLKLLLDSGVVTWFYGSMTAIVGSYMGFTTWHDLSGKK